VGCRERRKGGESAMDDFAIYGPQSGRGLPQSKSFASIGALNCSVRFWAAAVLCRFAICLC